MDQEAITHLTNKKKSFDRFLKFQTSHLQNNTGTTLSFYYFDLSQKLSIQQETIFLMNRELYKEDYGTFMFFSNFFKKNSCSSPGSADFVVFPFNINFFDDVDKQDLTKAIDELRKISGTKKVILFSISDFCAKSANRSTLFERKLLSDQSGFVFPWSIPSDIVICFESTIDFAFHDVSIFPLIEHIPVSFAENKKEFLFSFIGGYSKPGWPEGFIRSPQNSSTWESLRQRTKGTELILSTEEASVLYSNNPFFEIPKKSTFTLCPRGISSWSFRLFEAIHCGSIPIIMSDSYLKPFSEYIPWDNFSITIPEHSLSQVDEILRGISEEVIDHLATHLDKNQHWFTSSGLLSLVMRKLYVITHCVD